MERAIALAQYRAASLYPAIDAPEFTQHGGVIEPPLINFVNPGAGTIYYTTDGSDPRLPGGTVNPASTALTGGSVTESYFGLEATGWRYFVTPAGLGDSEIANSSPPHPSYNTGNWKHPDFDDTAWTAGQAMLGYGGITNRTVRTTIEFGGVVTNRYPTSYFRRTFNVPDASKVTKLLIDVIRDDGAIIYINGREAGRTNMNGGNQRYQDLAIGDASPEDQVVRIEWVPPAGLLRNNGNVLAVELHQSLVTSSDLGIDAALQGQVASSGITLTNSGTVKARLRSASGEWSALTEAFFTVGAEPASAQNLVVSKIHYHPAPPTLAEANDGFNEDRYFEFLELMNYGSRAVSLAGVQFVNGLEFTFDPGIAVQLAPGERAVLANNIAGFTARYGAGVRILGQFASGNLSNQGETIGLISATGADIRRFTYNDGGAWPDSPDGNGPALALVNPHSPPDSAGMSDPRNWRPASTIGGSPGADDRLPLAAWLAAQPNPNPLADPDGDGLNQLIAFATGARTSSEAHEFLPSVTTEPFTVAGATDVYPVISVRELIGAAGLSTRIESSPSLQGWGPAAMTLVSTTDHGDGTMTRRFRPSAPVATGRLFLRIYVSQQP